MTNIYSVFSAPGDPRAEVQIAGLLFALFEKNSYALCRYVRVDDAEPKLGILWPEITTEHKCFYFGQVHYSFFPSFKAKRMSIAHCSLLFPAILTCTVFRNP